MMRFLALTPLVLCAATLHAQDYSWPREIPFSQNVRGKIVLYQPQAETLTGNQLTARGAIALNIEGRPDPIFGAMWMSATVDVDRDSGMVWIHTLKITRVRWPDAKPDQQERFTKFVEQDFPAAGFRMTIERLQASLASADAQPTHTDGLKSDAPKLVFVEKLSVLLLYDGEPRLQPVPKTGLQVVVNTPFGVIKDTATKIFWLGAGDGLWYQATDAKGPWVAGGTPPVELLAQTGDSAAAAAVAASSRPDTLFGADPAAAPAAAAAAAAVAAPAAPRPDSAVARPDSAARRDSAAVRPDSAAARPDSATLRRDTTAATPTPAAAAAAAPAAAATPPADTTGAPQIITATEPTELISTQGPPKWKTTAGGKLLYVENTETPWLRETEGKDNYLLIAGRWFKSESTMGPWKFQRPDSLPAAFQDIPEESPIGGVRNSIAMTDEAQDALLDLAIPQTTAVTRAGTTLAVTYDGAPKFVDIAEAPGVSYASNTASKVLRVSGAYYACDNGVWFKSHSAQGPWAVADTIPAAQIAKIPPSSPAYALTFVHVYASTPEVVYVGYTPGYTGAYPMYGVPVYGTGYTYPPHVGTVYYPQPVTYGVSASYNPYTGYGMGTTWASGFFMFSVGVAIGSSYHRGYYPAGGYRGCFNCTINVNRNTNVNRGGGRGGNRGGRNQVNIGNSAGGGSRARPSNRATQRPSNSNLYNRPENRARTANAQTRQRASSQVGANRTARGSNNVFADRNGNVSRRSSGGWESRQGNSWQKGGGSRGQEREWQSRQRGASRSYGGGGSRGGSRGGGGRGGGGGRRR